MGKKGGGKERSRVTGQTGRRENSLRACACVDSLGREDENAIDLSSIVLSDHVLRALISIRLLSLFPPLRTFHSIPPRRVKPPLRG